MSQLYCGSVAKTEDISAKKCIKTHQAHVQSISPTVEENNTERCNKKTKFKEMKIDKYQTHCISEHDIGSEKQYRPKCRSAYGAYSDFKAELT